MPNLPHQVVDSPTNAEMLNVEVICNLNETVELGEIDVLHNFVTVLFKV